MTSFTWDYRNRLKQVTVKTSGGSTIEDDVFTYDVENRRIGKSTHSGGQTWTVYDGVNTYADFSSSGTLSFRYLYGRTMDFLLGRFDGANTSWYLGDKIGSIRLLVSSSGTVIDRVTYDSYGNILSETSPFNGDRFKFTSREYDLELGEYNMRARHFAPNIGRIISPDPIGFVSTDANLYRYVKNQPLSETDPTGLIGLGRWARLPRLAWILQICLCRVGNDLQSNDTRSLAHMSYWGPLMTIYERVCDRLRVAHTFGMFLTDEEREQLDRELDTLIQSIATCETADIAESKLQALGQLQHVFASICFKYRIDLTEKQRQFVHEYDRWDLQEVRKAAFESIKQRLFP